ncbi:MAG: HAMP domain-containing histidine kinase [Clostridia bacterium]|nr:HAMP domain-containing histidine kinase [Clostridia bacterium]
MFRPKGIFFKYMATFLLITVIIFAVLTSTISVIVNSYGTNMKTESLSNAANSAAVYIKNDFASEYYPDFDTYLYKEYKDLKLLLDLLSVNDTSMLMFIADSEGQVIHFGGSENISIATEANSGGTGKYTVPEKITKRLIQGEHVSLNDDMGGFFRSDHIYYSIPLYNDGDYVGAVFASANSTGTDALLSTMTRTVTLAVLWVMLASLVAMYFITERFLSPIRDMSRAAKSFANGSFDARVEVIGNDEVAELARAFNNMASSLQTLEDMRRSFLANVSHDLRTPMTTISGFIDGILDGAIPKDQHEYYLGIIAGEVRRLSRLVSSLLDISRIEAGERKFTPTVYDVCEQGREIIISNIQRLEEKRLDVRFECDADNMYVLADKDSIHQIFYNICDNAIKFSKEGGVYEIKITEKSGTVFVSVYNEGEGISKEDIPFIFERFYKSDKSRGKDKTGVGLGMYISRAIIEAQGQKIWVESEHTKWCRFTFTLQGIKNAERIKNNDT